MNNSSDLQLEEYKFAKERINILESRRHQSVLLSMTAFAAIIGFRQSVCDALIPYLSLCVLLYGAYSYSIYDVLQTMSTAFIIEKFEDNLGGLSFETGYMRIMSTSSPNSPLPGFIWPLSDPFLWLTVASLIISLVFGIASFNSSVDSLPPIAFPLYCAGLGIGHLAVLPSIFLKYRRNLNYFRPRWRRVIDLIQ